MQGISGTGGPANAVRCRRKSEDLGAAVRSAVKVQQRECMAALRRLPCKGVAGRNLRRMLLSLASSVLAKAKAKRRQAFKNQPEAGAKQRRLELKSETAEKKQTVSFMQCVAEDVQSDAKTKTQQHNVALYT